MALLNWPAVGLILGLVALFVFRTPLTRLLDRTRRIGRQGLDASDEPADSKLQIKPSAHDELRLFFDNALLVQREGQIQTELQRLNFKDATEREKFLIRLLASASIVQQFERIYSIIWGSQLGALQFLNSAGVTGVEPVALTAWYEQAAAQYADAYANYAFEQWLGFLESHQLVLSNAGRVAITLEGREFLKYLLHQGYRLYKAG